MANAGLTDGVAAALDVKKVSPAVNRWMHGTAIATTLVIRGTDPELAGFAVKFLESGAMDQFDGGHKKNPKGIHLAIVALQASASEEEKAQARALGLDLGVARAPANGDANNNDHTRADANGDAHQPACHGSIRCPVCHCEIRNNTPPFRFCDCTPMCGPWVMSCELCKLEKINKNKQEEESACCCDGAKLAFAKSNSDKKTTEPQQMSNAVATQTKRQTEDGGAAAPANDNHDNGWILARETVDMPDLNGIEQNSWHVVFVSGIKLTGMTTFNLPDVFLGLSLAVPESIFSLESMERSSSSEQSSSVAGLRFFLLENPGWFVSEFVFFDDMIPPPQMEQPSAQPFGAIKCLSFDPLSVFQMHNFATTGRMVGSRFSGWLFCKMKSRSFLVLAVTTLW